MSVEQYRQQQNPRGDNGMSVGKQRAYFWGVIMALVLIIATIVALGWIAGAVIFFTLLKLVGD